MTPKQFNDIQETIKATIKETVNGKIDRMNTKLDEYIKDDNEWKQGVTPSIETMKKTQNFAEGLLFILKFVGILGGAVGVIWAAIKYLK
jgi:phage-related protein